MAIVFEEKWAYEYRENQKLKRQTGDNSGGVEGSWVEDFTFGEEDDNDYYSGTDCLDCDDKDELHREYVN